MSIYLSFLFFSFGNIFFCVDMCDHHVFNVKLLTLLFGVDTGISPEFMDDYYLGKKWLTDSFCEVSFCENLILTRTQNLIIQWKIKK